MLDDEVNRDQLAASIIDRRFRMTVSRGYDEREVDDALDALATLVRSGGDADVVEAMVAGLRFATTRLRKGYDAREVDELVDSIAPALRGWAGQPSRAGTDAWVQRTTLPSPPTSDAPLPRRSSRTPGRAS